MKKKLTIIVIFLFALTIRLWNLGEAGRTWDEQTYAQWGYKFIVLIKNLDFSNPYWYKTSGSPPLTRYIYGIGASKDYKSLDNNGDPVFNYNLTYTRLASVLMSSLTAIVILLLAWKYFSPFIGVSAAIIYSLLPLSVAYGQIATLESPILLFFSVTVFSFFNFLSKSSKKNIIFTGILLGLALGVKYTNVLLFPLMLFIYLVWFINKKKNKKENIKSIKSLISIYLISFFTFFAIWPMPWFHIKEVLDYNYALRVGLNNYPSIELFFGKVIHVPILYFFVFFLITTPFLILILFLVGAKNISDFTRKTIINKSEKWIVYSLILWFCLPFIQSFYNFRQQGIRFIIEIYAPLSIISAIGLDFLVSKITQDTKKKAAALIIVAIYMAIVLARITPYYLDYYNLVVGGAKTVHDKKLFQLGWWGEGIKEAELYLEKHAINNSSVGLAVDPIASMPQSKKIRTYEYSNSKEYDYVLVGYYRITRLSFDDSFIKRKYKLVYTVKADGADIIYVYKKR